MKKFKSGFTLAEVLITLGIIGVVAAIVMPTMMTNHTFRTVGVKLSKFTAQLEGASRPYVVSNTNFTDAAGALAFAREAFLLRNNDDFMETLDCDEAANADDARCDNVEGSITVLNEDIVMDSIPAGIRTAQTLNDIEGATVLQLKDGTSLIMYMLPEGYNEGESINTFQVGEAVFGIAFNPNVQGLPRAVQKNHQFIVTELGYVYPDSVNDRCFTGIFNNEFITNSATFAEGAACDATASQTTGGDEGTGD